MDEFESDFSSGESLDSIDDAGDYSPAIKSEINSESTDLEFLDELDVSIEGIERCDFLEDEPPDTLSDVAPGLSNEEITEILDSAAQDSEVMDLEEIPDPLENADVDLQETEINYNEIYEGIEQEALEQGFEDIDIATDPERLDSALEGFDETTWESLSLDGKKETMSNLADCVMDTIKFDNPPSIEYYNNPQEGDFGGYDHNTNTLRVNEYMLYNSEEAADTVAHELWHAHQYECAVNPQSTLDYQYQYNFANYIPPDLGQEAYESQLVEAEARAFAAQFKDRLANITGRNK